jgi:hypothetical protein
MLRIVILGLLALFSVSCSTPEERYAWNVQNVHVCPSARKLPQEDVQAIARLIAQRTRKNMLAITALPPTFSLDRLDVTLGYHDALKEDDPDHNQFGSCLVRKDDKTWKIAEFSNGMSVSLLRLSCVEHN